MYTAPEGFYHNAIGIFKVVENGASGRRYAKKLTKHEDGTHTWEFAKGSVTKLQVNTKLSQEAAAQFGALYGTCICCLRTLDNEESIALGIGPICLKKYF
jgi:Family of unknown function (DUF6011)